MNNMRTVRELIVFGSALLMKSTMLTVVKAVIAILGVLSVLILVTDARLPNGTERRYSGAQVWRVPIKNVANEKKFEDLKEELPGVEMIHQTNSDLHLLVRASILESAKKQFASAEVKYDVLIDDLEERIKNEDPMMTEDEMITQRQLAYNFTFVHYHSLKDIHEYMSTYLIHQSPPTGGSYRYNSIGKSLEGRDLNILEIENDPKAPWLWIDGGIHAREWLSPSSVMWIAKNLMVEGDRNKFQDATKKVNYYILPVVNPDGYEYSREEDRMWRKNRNVEGKINRRWKGSLFEGQCKRGVDLNRNFDIAWSSNAASSTNQCHEVYKGAHANSELETQHIINFLSDKISQVKAFISFHTYSELIMYPYAYAKDAPPLPNHEELHKIAEEAAKNIKLTTGSDYKVGRSPDLIYAASGTSADWAASQGIPYVYTVELSKYSFVHPSSHIIPIGKEGFEVVKAVAEAIVKNITHT